MLARHEAYVWAVIYGPCWGLSAALWQEAAADGRTGWAVLFGGYTVTTIPWYYAWQWRELRG